MNTIQKCKNMQSYDYNIDTIFGDPSIRTGHFGVKYRGINYVKCPFDYVLYQMLVEEVILGMVFRYYLLSPTGSLSKYSAAGLFN